MPVNTSGLETSVLLRRPIYWRDGTCHPTFLKLADRSGEAELAVRHVALVAAADHAGVHQRILIRRLEIDPDMGDDLAAILGDSHIYAGRLLGRLGVKFIQTRYGISIQFPVFVRLREFLNAGDDLVA